MRATSSRSAKSSPTALRELPPSVQVGRVIRPHGVTGEVLVEVSTDVPGRLDPGAELRLEPPERRAGGAEARGGGEPLPDRLRVTASRPHRGALLVRFEGIDDRDAAARLRGAALAVERERVPPAEAGSYYHFELLGCRCRDVSAGELGEVVDLIEDGGGLILVVDDGRRRVPVPFVERFLKRVDVAAGTIEVELPPGLIETCASGS